MSQASATQPHQPPPLRYFRKVIRITCEDSPNVRFARAEKKLLGKASGAVIIPGVLPWSDLVKRRATWDKVRQCIGLDAQFYSGAELLLFPPNEYNRSSAREAELAGMGRVGEAMGVDPAEGGDKSSWTIGDRHGILDQVSLPTPDTNDVVTITLDLMGRWRVPAESVLFDRGGGGKQHADRLRSRGVMVESVGFGASPSLPIQDVKSQTPDRQDMSELKYAYLNLRAEMYHQLSLAACFPQEGVPPYCLPARFAELRRQLAIMPKMYNEEGRMYLPPKGRKAGSTLKTPTLSEMLGCSPDEADSAVLMYRALTRPLPFVAGGV